MNLKFKDKPIWKFIGIAYLIIAFIWFGLMLLLLNTVGFVLDLLMVMDLFMILGSLVLFVYYIKLNTIDYLRIDNNILSIHKGLRIRKEINIEEIEKGYIARDKLILILNSEKEIDIYINQLLIKDYEKLISELSNSFVIGKL